MPGIFISRGMTITIPSFSLRIREDGQLEGDPITLHVRYDVCPTWVELSVRHLERAKIARTKRDEVWGGKDEEAKVQALEAEFEASMQAIMAAAIAWDAIYAVLREHVTIPPSMAEKWRTGRTARYSQVAETIRRAFALKPKGATLLRSNLKALYSYRDMAVHPSGKISAPLLHPELSVGMEWRFVFFRARNAEVAVLGAAGMLWDLAQNGKSKDEGITKYQSSLLMRLQEIFPQGAPKPPASAPSDA